MRIVRASAFEDVLAMAAESAAVEAYTELVAKGSQVHAAAWACGQEAARRLGELTSQLPKAKPGPQRAIAEIVEDPETIPPPVQTKRQRIAELGLKQQQVTKCERSAEIERAEYDARIEVGKADIIAGRRPRDITAVTSATTHDSDEYGTPAQYLELARGVFGGPIDLDPASNAFAANVVKAGHHYTKEDSGLLVPWEAGSLWMNPPFRNKLISAFVDKLVSEWHAERFERAIVLTNCDPSTGWYKSLLRECDLFCLPDHRIAFKINGEPVKGNFFAQTFFYFGTDLAAFQRHFGVVGQVCMRFMGVMS